MGIRQFVLSAKKRNEKMKKKIQETSSGILLSVAINFMLMLYAPMELYFSNKSEFWFDIYYMFPIAFGVFVVTTLLGMITMFIFRLIHKKVYEIGLVAYFITFVATYIQGNFLVMGLPALNGTPIQWELYTAERIKCIIMWIIISIIIIAVDIIIKSEKFETLVSYASIFITLILIITIMSVCMMNNGFENKESIVVTDKDLYTISSEDNFIILMLDSLDSRDVNEIVNEEPEYREMLEDFVYYSNTSSTYGYTHESVPYILSGVWYENEIDFEEYRKDVFKNSSLFKEMDDRGFISSIYSSEVPYTDKCVLRFNNVLESTDNYYSIKEFIGYFSKLVGYKYAIFELKSKCIFDMAKFNDLKIAPEGTAIFFPDNDYFNNEIVKEVKNNSIKTVGDKIFKFIHLDGAHAPYIYDREMKYIEDGTDRMEVTRGCLKLVKNYMDFLKMAGVYDKTTIIVMADHGYTEDDDPWARWNPAFMIKGYNEKHEFQKDRAPISYTDLQETYSKLLKGEKNETLFSWKEGDYRERRFMYYEYEDAKNMFEGIITDKAANYDAMQLTGKEYHR